jgi:hypothetical protein
MYKSNIIFFFFSHTRNTHTHTHKSLFSFLPLFKDSYNECLDEDCDYGQMKYSYITQHILGDYGFVEGYPRRFMFHIDASGDKRHRSEYLVAEIDEDPNDPNHRTFEWHFRTPSDAQLHWIHDQSSRLKDMKPVMDKGLKALPKGHERNTIQAFYLAYQEALQLAFDHRDDDVSQNTNFPQLEDEEEDDEKGEEL